MAIGYERERYNSRNCVSSRREEVMLETHNLYLGVECPFHKRENSGTHILAARMILVQRLCYILAVMDGTRKVLFRVRQPGKNDSSRPKRESEPVKVCL